MFVGHTALALAAKRRAPTLSLGWLLAAAVGLDLLWPVLLIAGVERAHGAVGATAFNSLVFDWYPWSHSLAMALVWGLAALAVARWRGVGTGAAALLGGLVVSHWVLDYVTHVPDLPLWPGASSPRVGLGLWQSVGGTFAIEGLMFVAGIAIYTRASRARDRIGSIGFWAFLLASAAMWASGPWSPPPPSQAALGWLALGGYLLVLWAGWVDRHRR
jgi:hypothetical protein